jgi:hypothetical protein
LTLIEIFSGLQTVKAKAREYAFTNMSALAAFWGVEDNANL